MKGYSWSIKSDKQYSQRTQYETVIIRHPSCNIESGREFCNRDFEEFVEIIKDSNKLISFSVLINFSSFHI